MGVERPEIRLRVLPGEYAVCRMPPDRELTVPVAAGPLYAVTRTADELSVVCAKGSTPTHATVEPGWAAVGVAGPLDFALVGILAAIANALANVGVAIFAVSTYDTDYVLLKTDQLEKAVEALRAAGYAVDG